MRFCNEKFKKNDRIYISKINKGDERSYEIAKILLGKKGKVLAIGDMGESILIEFDEEINNAKYYQFNRYVSNYKFELVEPEPENTDQFEEWEDIDESNEYEFKVGDKVTCIQPKSNVEDRFNLDGNKIYVISEIVGDDINLEGGRYGYDPKRFIKYEIEEIDQFEDWEDINEEYNYDTKKFEKGDRVIVNGEMDEVHFNNEMGTVLYNIDKGVLFGYEIEFDVIGIEFDKTIEDIGEREGHKGEYNEGKDGYCWNVYENLVELITEETDQFEDWEDINERKIIDFKRFKYLK